MPAREPVERHNPPSAGRPAPRSIPAAAAWRRCARLTLGAVVLLGAAATVPAARAAGAAAAPPADLAADLTAMEDADRAFARLSRQQGLKAAFLAYMADDAVLFRPGPVPGPAYVGARPSPAIDLVWAPVHAVVAKSGDLGYTTGPYQVRDLDAAHAVEDQGWYVTIWRKQPDGSWKLIVDQGVSTPPPTGIAATLIAAAAAGTAGTASGAAAAAPPAAGSTATPPAAGTAGAAGMAAGSAPQDAAQGLVMRADRDFAGDANVHGPRAAYMTSLAPGARLYRQDAAPVEGRDAIGKALSGGHQPNPGGQATAAGVSAAGDLGYTYGSTAVTGPAALSKSATAAATTSMYLRLWQRQGSGTYTIILDLMKPLPPPAPEVHH